MQAWDLAFLASPPWAFVSASVIRGCEGTRHEAVEGQTCLPSRVSASYPLSISKPLDPRPAYLRLLCRRQGCPPLSPRLHSRARLIPAATLRQVTLEVPSPDPEVCGQVAGALEGMGWGDLGGGSETWGQLSSGGSQDGPQCSEGE